MNQSYNFTTNLRNIIAPDMKRLGFKLRNTKFERDRNKYKEEIYFQRSQFNLPNYPFQFYINLGVDISNPTFNQYIRLDYPTNLVMPDYYNEYILSFEDDGCNRFEQFNSIQKEEISLYVESRKWKYDSEENLKENLETALQILLSKGMYFFDKMNSYISVSFEPSILLKHMRNIQNEINGLSDLINL